MVVSIKVKRAEPESEPRNTTAAKYEGRISPSSRFSFHGIPGRSRPEEVGHKQAERDRKLGSFF
jgi:hypothetical protein